MQEGGGICNPVGDGQAGSELLWGSGQDDIGDGSVKAESRYQQSEVLEDASVRGEGSGNAAPPSFYLRWRHQTRDWSSTCPEHDGAKRAGELRAHHPCLPCIHRLEVLILLDPALAGLNCPNFPMDKVPDMGVVWCESSGTSVRKPSIP